MTYNFIIPFRNADPMFGTAFPKFVLTPKQKANFIHRLFCDIAGRTSPSSVVSVVYDEISKQYKAQSHLSGRAGYDATIKMEAYFPRVRRTPITYIFKKIFGQIPFTNPRPQINYLLSADIYGDVTIWIKDNIRPRDYQIYSKFGSDVSLGFRDPEHAALFKLTFGDKDI